MSFRQHATRVVLLMACGSALFGWLASRTDILFPDGLRYVAQARAIEEGAWKDAILGSVDHPLYPIGIVAAHRTLGGESPLDWQRSAQLASVVAGVLLIVPLYLVAAELFGAGSAWLGVLLALIVPLTGHVMGDALSESTFLLFYTWGFWTALRFLRDGRFFWLPPMIGLAALAYLTRPEGLLLPGAMVATLALMPLLHSTRMNWPRWWAAVAFLVVGPMLVVVPYASLKGGIGTKPAVGRLLGTAPRSTPMAVERERPLDPDQSAVKTYAMAGRAVVRAVRGAVTLPLLLLAPLGLHAARRSGSFRPRPWLFLGVVLGSATLALIRLHATGGYCEPRHAMILAYPLIASAAAGLAWLISAVTIPGRWIGLEDGRYHPGPAVWALVLAGFTAANASATFAPINAGFRGYRLAGEWIAENVVDGASIVDVTGWSQYYSERPGYTFANLTDGMLDPNARWIVVRDAHINGPWVYCEQFRAMIGDRRPLKTFPGETPVRGVAQIYIFDRGEPTGLARSPGDTAPAPRR